ncbi:hypothetical protein NP493_1851g00024 [Ridgeia piscesae]|uniref:FAD dependent oxidoreductase domain-containing protein n=1 Tax=Ridgeia piscesae TaxID=27915 RepID=A0AAD9JT74_RIDPI|nr:hypothetical protein NP493_1851g00024 [Ridgeia piscesae]
MPRVAVIGAGAVGLSTAVLVQRRIPGVDITIIADKFDKDTTSDGAAGIFRPSKNKTPGVPIPLLRQWLRDSWEHYSKLALSPDAKDAGCFFTSGYQFYNNDDQNPFDEELLHDILPNYRRLSEAELNMFPGNRYKQGWFLTTVMAESRRYLPYLMRKFILAGGKVENRKVYDLKEFVGMFDVVVNCAGFGSCELLKDNKMIPIRGHLFRVEAPWLKHFIYAMEQDTYIIPGMDNVVIGGTLQKYDTGLEHREEDSKAVWERACKMVPSLQKATVQWQWVGLRPFREPLRLEKELMTFPQGQLNVVHNYGHGAEGVGMSWGTAVHASRLVTEVLQQGQAKL